MPNSPMPLQSGDVVTLKKPHPCGGRQWKVTRTGADIGLECLTCGRRVLLDREEVERRAVQVAPAMETCL